MIMREKPRPYEKYRHFKGESYQIIAIAIHSETDEEMVVYQALYGDYSIYVRPLSMFMDKIDSGKYPEYAGCYRFTKVNDTNKINCRNNKKENDITETDKTKDSRDTVKEEINEDLNSETGIKPELLMFLEAKGYEEKLNTLLLIKNKLDQEMINAIAISLDVEIKEGTVEERFEAIKSCLLTKEKYECSRRLT